MSTILGLPTRRSHANFHIIFRHIAQLPRRSSRRITLQFASFLFPGLIKKTVKKAVLRPGATNRRGHRQQPFPPYPRANDLFQRPLGFDINDFSGPGARLIIPPSPGNPSRKFLTFHPLERTGVRFRKSRSRARALTGRLARVRRSGRVQLRIRRVRGAAFTMGDNLVEFFDAETSIFSSLRARVVAPCFSRG